MSYAEKLQYEEEYIMEHANECAVYVAKGYKVPTVKLNAFHRLDEYSIGSLGRKHNENAIVFDDEIANHLVFMNLKLSQIKKTSSGDYYLELYDSSYECGRFYNFTSGSGADIKNSIVCYLADDQLEVLKTIKGKDDIAILGQLKYQQFWSIEFFFEGATIISVNGKVVPQAYNEAKYYLRLEYNTLIENEKKEFEEKKKQEEQRRIEEKKQEEQRRIEEQKQKEQMRTERLQRLEKLCPECGKEIGDGNFCPFCGAKRLTVDELKNTVTRSNIREIVRYWALISKGRTKLYFGEQLPMKQISNAMVSFAQGLDPKDILAFIDSTVFGSGKTGFIFTKDRVYFKQMLESKCSFYYKDMVSVELVNSGNILKIEIETVDNKFTISESLLDLTKFVKLFIQIKEQYEQGEN